MGARRRPGGAGASSHLFCDPLSLPDLAPTSPPLLASSSWAIGTRARRARSTPIGEASPRSPRWLAVRTHGFGALGWGSLRVMGRFSGATARELLQLGTRQPGTPQTLLRTARDGRVMMTCRPVRTTACERRSRLTRDLCARTALQPCLFTPCVCVRADGLAWGYVSERGERGGVLAHLLQR